MTMTANQHARSLAECKHLDTLAGSSNSKRRKIRQYHKQQDGKCIWCGEMTFLWWEVTNEEFRKMDATRMGTYEHLVPKSHGGERTLANGACACQECNTLRKNIPHDSFKYVSAEPTRFQKWKDMQIAKVVANKERKEIRKRNSIARREKVVAEKKRNIMNLAIMFQALKHYHEVDFCRQFFYNRRIIKTFGEHYGLL